ncbi:MAG: hypothetical protein AVDCRST_MAG26-875, partial [uncultured Chloroflexia bacterium]
ELHRQNVGVPRLWQRVHVHGGRAGILRAEGLRQRADPVPELPARAQAAAQRIRWRQLRFQWWLRRGWQLQQRWWLWRRRRRIQPSRACPARDGVLELRPPNDGAVRPTRRPPGLLRRLLRAAAGRWTRPFRVQQPLL